MSDASVREVPASIGQRLTWFLEHYRPEAGTLNCPVLTRLRGPLPPATLGDAVDRLTARHEALRTTLHRRGRQLVQTVHPAGPVPVTTVDLAADGPASDDEIERVVAAEIRTVIPVDTWPTRVTLWRCGPDDHLLCLNMHHLVADAWSCGIVLQDLIKLLDPRTDAGALPPIARQYSDFATWQHEQLTGGHFDEHRRYWEGKLDGMHLPALPRRQVDPAGASARPVVRAVDLDPDVVNGLRAVARSERTTAFTALLAVYYATLAEVTGQSDLAVASLFANRSRRDVVATVGMFSNMLVLRTAFDPSATFADLVRATRQTVLDAFVHEAVPYQMLSLPNADRGKGKVEDVVFQMLITATPGMNLTAGDVELELYMPEATGTRFGIELNLIPLEHTYRALLQYSDAEFDVSWGTAFLDRYIELAELVGVKPDAPLPISV